MIPAILLVEDDHAFCDLVEQLLRSQGYRVKIAGRVAQALAMLTPDVKLVIADGLLPDGNGIGLVGALRAKGFHDKVIFMSSVIRDKTSFLRLTRDLQVDAVLRKPVKTAEILAQVQRLIGPPTEPEPTQGEDDYLAALCSLYNDELPGRVGQIEKSLRMVHREHDADALGVAQRLAHQMRGTAGSFGFAEVGEAAGVLEDRLKSVHPTDSPPTVWRGVEWAFLQLRNSTNGRGEIRKAQPPMPAPSWAKLLFASTNPVNVNAFQRLARDNSTLGVVVHTEKDALAAAFDPSLDAVLIDTSFGGAPSTLALARRIRSIDGLKHLPVAVVGDHQQLFDRIASVEAGASVLIETPLHAASLRSATEHLLALRRHGRPKVLLVDDDVEFCARTAYILKQAGYEVAVCHSPQALLPVLERETPALLVLDHVLPGANGLELCRMLRSTEAWKALPILLLTGRTGTDIRIAAYKAGADDYLTKPLVKEEFLARVQVRLDRARLIDAQANHDALTGLLNRRAFFRLADPRLAEVRRAKRPLAIALLDLDHFKQVNDERGHLAGDRVLVSLGSLIASEFRVEDLRARWGGEEFLLCFSGENGDNAKHLVERLLDALKSVSFGSDKEEQFSVTFSAGIAAFPEDGSTFDELLRTADRRMYLAKASGRACICNGNDDADSEDTEPILLQASA